MRHDFEHGEVFWGFHYCLYHHLVTSALFAKVEPWQAIDEVSVALEQVLINGELSHWSRFETG